MKIYMAKDGDRIDVIIFKAYGNNDADVTAAVLDANEHLLDANRLKAGDIVYLPEIQQSKSEDQTKVLW
jgi:phage tail protein X